MRRGDHEERRARLSGGADAMLHRPPLGGIETIEDSGHGGFLRKG
jgi:hypothetical protein